MVLSLLNDLLLLVLLKKLLLREGKECSQLL